MVLEGISYYGWRVSALSRVLGVGTAHPSLSAALQRRHAKPPPTRLHFSEEDRRNNKFEKKQMTNQKK